MKMRREKYIKVQKHHNWHKGEWSQLILMLLTKSKTRNVTKHTLWNVPQLSKGKLNPLAFGLKLIRT